MSCSDAAYYTAGTPEHLHRRSVHQTKRVVASGVVQFPEIHMHDRSMSGAAGLMPARTHAFIAAFVSMMIGCQPAFALQSSQAGGSLLATSEGPATPAKLPPRASKVGFVDSLRQPASVLYDAVRDVFYISNVDGGPSVKDGAGFITKLRADGTREELRWIDGARNGVTLNAPQGMAILGDVLWVADIDVMRAFDAQTGAPLTMIDLAPLGARFLKDVTIGPDHGVYVTGATVSADAGTGDATSRDRIFRVELRGRASAVLESARLKQPNGIVWDRFNNRFLIALEGSDTIWTWRGGSFVFSPFAAGPGQYDGIAMAGDRVLVTNRVTGGVHELIGNALVTLIEDAGDVADVEWDPKRGLLYVPLTAQNRVDIFRIHSVSLPAR
jgi:sugar lactone lactonase YvrE